MNEKIIKCFCDVKLSSENRERVKAYSNNCTSTKLLKDTFENIDPVIMVRQFESQGGVVGLENAEVVIQNGQLAPRVTQKSTRKMELTVKNHCP